MTGGNLLVLLYGLSAWGAGLNCPAWCRLLYRRARDPRRAESWRKDNILLVRLGLVLLSAGVSGLAGVRLLGFLLDGIPIVVPSRFGVAFIALMALSEPVFLRVDEIHAQALGRRSLAWRVYWAGAIAGVVLMALRVAAGG